jgi:hypothetical protein
MGKRQVKIAVGEKSLSFVAQIYTFVQISVIDSLSCEGVDLPQGVD